MKTKPIAVFLLLAVIFFSCSRNSEQKPMTADLIELKPQNEPPQTKVDNEKQQIPVAPPQPVFADSAAPLQKPAALNPGWDKKMIKTGTLKVEVKNFRNFSNAVHNTIKQYGGYIAQEEQNSSGEKTETVITIKVPVDQFENMINQLSGEEDKVLERKISTEDVTTDIIDTQSRLEAKKKMRAKYLELMQQSKNMEDVLQVQNSVNNIQEELESAAGRIQSLSRQALFSTIQLTFFQPAAGYVGPEEHPGITSRIAAAFKTGGAFVADLFVGLISIWPLLLLAAGIYLVWKRMKPGKVTANNSVSN